MSTSTQEQEQTQTQTQATQKTLADQLESQTQTQTQTDTQSKNKSEFDLLKEQLEVYKQRELEQQQVGMSEEKKELENLKKELAEMAKKPLLDSKYFKETELSNYTHEQLQAMNDLLNKVVKQGQPVRGAKTPEKSTKKEPVGRYFDPYKGKFVP